MRSSDSSWFVQELVLYSDSAALSCVVLFAGLRQLDPNCAASQKMLQQKKEIAKLLGRLPVVLIQSSANCSLEYSSTCATYGEPDKMPITEETPQVGQ